LKSKLAYRTIPMPSMVVNALREWRLVCPKGELGLVLPSGAGRVESHSNISQRGLAPILRKAGVEKYGLHSLRHACASLWIESGMNAKRIQTLMGHSSIQLTFDRYGTWFVDDAADQKAAEDIQFRLLGKI
jgi:integrase